MRYASKATRFLSDQMERAVIGVSQPRSLLNRQIGGKRAALIVDAAGEISFFRCHTNLISNLNHSHLVRDTIVAREVAKLLEKWYEGPKISKYGKELLCSESYVHNVIEQAVPFHYEGVALAALCGEQTPLKTLQDDSSF